MFTSTKPGGEYFMQTKLLLISSLYSPLECACYDVLPYVTCCFAPMTFRCQVFYDRENTKMTSSTKLMYYHSNHIRWSHIIKQLLSFGVGEHEIYGPDKIDIHRSIRRSVLQLNSSYSFRARTLKRWYDWSVHWAMQEGLGIFIHQR